MKLSRILLLLLSILIVADSALAADADTTKASKIIIPKLVFRQANVDEALAFFLKKSREFDPEKSGVPIILVNPEKTKAVKVDLDLVNVSLADAVKYFAIAAGLEMTRDGEAIVLKMK